jgi:hypothetical protein
LDKLLRDSYDSIVKRRRLRNHSTETEFCDIPKPVLAVGFALEQPLRDATLACSASGISKQLEYNICGEPTIAPPDKPQPTEFQKNKLRLRYGKSSAIRLAEKIVGKNTPSPNDTPKSIDDLSAVIDGDTANTKTLRTTELDRRLAELLVDRGILNKWQTAQLLEGRTKFTLGNYLILNAIGKGGYGHVFLGREGVVGESEVDQAITQNQTDSKSDLKPLVALKVLPLAKTTPELLERFRNEITLQKRLCHQNLVRFIDSGHDGSVDFMVHEFIDGGDVKALLQREGVIPYDIAAVIITELSKGVQYLHDQGIIHRDIKPANILISSAGEAKLIDFGLSVDFNCSRAQNDKTQLESESQFDKDVDKMSVDKIAGTIDYVAPDQICNPSEPIPAWDIYSIGCSFYQLLTGKVPFPKGNMKQKLAAHVNIEPTDPRVFNQSIPFHIAELILLMLAKDPTKRIKSANEIIERLSHWLPPDGLTGQLICT